MIRILTTNEQRLKALNSMRASYRGHQLLNQSRFDTTPDTENKSRWDDEDDFAVNEVDVLKETAETMYATTGDTIWLAF